MDKYHAMQSNFLQQAKEFQTAAADAQTLQEQLANYENAAKTFYSMTTPRQSHEDGYFETGMSGVNDQALEVAGLAIQTPCKETFSSLFRILKRSNTPTDITTMVIDEVNALEVEHRAAAYVAMQSVSSLMDDDSRKLYRAATLTQARSDVEMARRMRPCFPSHYD